MRWSMRAGMPIAQAVCEGFESRDSSIAGLAAAMGRGGTVPTEDEEEDSDEDGSGTDEESDEDQEEAGSRPPKAPLRAPAVEVPMPVVEQDQEEDTEEEEEDDVSEGEEVLTTMSMEAPAPAMAQAQAQRVASSVGRQLVADIDSEDEAPVVTPVARRPSVSAPGSIVEALPGKASKGKSVKKKGSKAAAAAAEAAAAEAAAAVAAQPIIVEENAAGKLHVDPGKVEKKKKSKKVADVGQMSKGPGHIEDPAAGPSPAVVSPDVVVPGAAVEQPGEAGGRKKKKKKEKATVAAGDVGDVAAHDAAAERAADNDVRQQSLRKTRSVTVRADVPAKEEEGHGDERGDGGAGDGDQVRRVWRWFPTTRPCLHRSVWVLHTDCCSRM